MDCFAILPESIITKRDTFPSINKNVILVKYIFLISIYVVERERNVSMYSVCYCIFPTYFIAVFYLVEDLVTNFNILYY